MTKGNLKQHTDIHKSLEKKSENSSGYTKAFKNANANSYELLDNNQIPIDTETEEILRAEIEEEEMLTHTDHADFKFKPRHEFKHNQPSKQIMSAYGWSHLSFGVYLKRDLHAYPTKKTPKMLHLFMIKELP